MPLSLEQYVHALDGRRDLTFPAAPPPHPPKAKPKLAPMPEVRLVAWNIYGTLLNITTGQLVFEHPQKFMMELALDKTVEEFKMWASMSRKPGKPSEYMAQLYQRALDELRMAPSHGEKYPEIQAEKIWDKIAKMLFQKDYKYDVNYYGPLPDYTRKIAYFFHASLQGTAGYDGAGAALEHIRSCGIKQAFLADAQCFTPAQLQRGLGEQTSLKVDDFFDRSLQTLSCEIGGKKPSERLFKQFVQSAGERGIAPHEILHLGSRLVQDIAPAKKAGMRTALFAGDKESLQASVEQLKDPATRPELLLTELSQISEIIAPRG